MAVLQIGPVNRDVLERVSRTLCKVFANIESVVSEDVLPLPEEAYNSGRGQYYSSMILSLIQMRLRNTGVDRALGVTEADLYVPRLNFVFGEARPTGVAIISLHRLRPEFYGEPPDPGLLRERADKEAVHEIGHTLGLGHCRDPMCVMFFSNSILDTDRKALDFCRRCSVKASMRVMGL